MRLICHVEIQGVQSVLGLCNTILAFCKGQAAFLWAIPFYNCWLPFLLLSWFCTLVMSSPCKRRDIDVMKLMMSDYKVEMASDEINEFLVEFRGPKDSPYQDGVWKIRVELPDAYPYKSPSIGFVNKIFHPNVDEMSGSVCLDVINQSWSPMFDLLNVFEVFLPQLLLYPNPTDPLNGEAAALLMRDCEEYEKKVKEHCETFAKAENFGSVPSEDSNDEEVSEDYVSSEEELEDE